MEISNALDKLFEYLDTAIYAGFFTDEEVEDIYKLETKLGSIPLSWGQG